MEATKDFTKFYKEWSKVVSHAVYRAGFRQVDAEDLIQDIFSDLYVGGYLNKYNPKIATFATYIWRHVNVRILDRKRFLAKLSNREAMIMNDEDKTIDFPDLRNQFSGTEFSLTVNSIVNDLEKLPATKSKNLARLFKDIVDQIVTNGRFSQVELAKRYGISRQAVSSQIHDLSKTLVMKNVREAIHI